MNDTPPNDPPVTAGTARAVAQAADPHAGMSPYASFDEKDAAEVAVQALTERSTAAVSIFRTVLGFSLINMALIAFHSPFVLGFGLNITDEVSTFARTYGMIHFLWNIIPIGFYYLLLCQTSKHRGWIPALMAFYALDGLLPLIGIDGMGVSIWAVVGIGIHALVLYLLWQGFQAAVAAERLKALASVSTVSGN